MNLPCPSSGLHSSFAFKTSIEIGLKEKIPCTNLRVVQIRRRTKFGGPLLQMEKSSVSFLAFAILLIAMLRGVSLGL